MEAKASILFFLLVALVSVQCRQHYSQELKNEILEDLVERYREYRENQDEEDELLEGLEENSIDPEDIFDTVEAKPKLSMCHGAGVDCYHCTDCFPGGWCIKNPGSKPKCLCNYGWTGPDAEYLPNTDDPEWGRNRIRADNCLKACHYTHDIRNVTCAGGTKPTVPTPKCHHLCGKYEGKCLPDGRCQCCRGWNGPNGKYSSSDDRYYADYCSKECPYLGRGVPNPTCKPGKTDPPSCNPKCVKTDGKCVENGRCACCLGWTGPNAKYGVGKYENRVLADYCDVYCPYTLTRRNDICVIDDYVKRRREAGHRINV